MTDEEYAATLVKLKARELKKKIAHLCRTYRRSLPDSTLARIGGFLRVALAEQQKRNGGTP